MKAYRIYIPDQVGGLLLPRILVPEKSLMFSFASGRLYAERILVTEITANEKGEEFIVDDHIVAEVEYYLNTRDSVAEKVRMFWRNCSLDSKLHPQEPPYNPVLVGDSYDEVEMRERIVEETPKISPEHTASLVTLCILMAAVILFGIIEKITGDPKVNWTHYWESLGILGIFLMITFGLKFRKNFRR